MLISDAATECVYHPKQKPGLKPGAVEALTRRVGTRPCDHRDLWVYNLTRTAFLEQILLDEAGNVRSRYNEEPKQQSNGDIPHNGSRVDRETATSITQSLPAVTSAPPEQLTTSAAEPVTTANPLKRKHKDAEDERWFFATEELDLAQHLPPQGVLLEVVNYFTTSFHHWIPYLHKKRLHDKVTEGVCSNGLLLVLHALVAVALRHMEPNVLFMDQDQIQRQSTVSRIIVETHAIRSVSIESLQALIFIVFDYVSVYSLPFRWLTSHSSMTARTIAHGRSLAASQGRSATSSSHLNPHRRHNRACS
jgi:hypothetical protein